MLEQEKLLPLLCSTAQGDKDAFSDLYSRTSGQLFAVLLRLLKSRELAEEALQDAYVRIWHNSGNYQRGKGTVLTWMVSIARYRALDLIKYHKVRNEVDLEDNEPPSESNNIDDNFLGPEKAKLSDCMDELDTLQRQAIHLAYFNGLSHQEVVNHLSEPLGTIKSWIRRGLQSLQRCLSI